MTTKEEMKTASKAYHQLKISYQEFIGRYFSGFGVGAKPINEEELAKVRKFRLKIKDSRTNLTKVRKLYYSLN